VALHRFFAGDLTNAGHLALRNAESRGFYYNNPRSAKEMAWLPAMMK
jgi:hypothetical protein